MVFVPDRHRVATENITENFHIVLMVLVGISGENVASHMAQQNVETTSSHV